MPPMQDTIVCASHGEMEVLLFYDPLTNAFDDKPSDSVLKIWGLKLGLNEVTISVLHDTLKKTSGKRVGRPSGSATAGGAEKSDGTSVAETAFGIFLYPLFAKFAVVDIDGTITISDVRGYVESVFLGVYTHVHEGVVRFLKVLEENFGYSLIFLTSRPLAHQEETRLLLANARDFDLDMNGKKCIDHTLHISRSPLFVNLKSVTKAVYGEVIAKSSGDFKAGVLMAVNKVFSRAGRFEPYEKSLDSSSGGGGADAAKQEMKKVSRSGSVFRLGVGNKDTDMVAYLSAGVPDGRLLFVDSSSSIRLWHPSAELVSSLKEGGKEGGADEGKAADKAPSSRPGKGKADQRTHTAGPCEVDVFTSYMDQNLLYYLDEISSTTVATAATAAASSSSVTQVPSSVMHLQGKKPLHSSGKLEQGSGRGGAKADSRPLAIGSREERSGTLSGPQSNVMRDDER